MLFQMSYTSDNVIEGKRVAKEALQKRLGLSTSERPLVGIITRLTHQKGIHLIKHAIWKTLERNGQVIIFPCFSWIYIKQWRTHYDMCLHRGWLRSKCSITMALLFCFIKYFTWKWWSWQVVLLGSAPDPCIQNDFVGLANNLHSSHNDRARLCLTYDEPLSHLVSFGSWFWFIFCFFT